MNRPLEFRVWCKTTRHFTNIPFYSCSGNQLLWLHTGNNLSISNLDDGEYVIQQFTGLFDKNKKKIFEGDILRYSWEREDKRTSFVTFMNGRFIAQRKRREGYPIEGYFDLGGMTQEVTILGNIFENPELLK